MGDEDALIYISSRKVQCKPESCSEEADKPMDRSSHPIWICFFPFPYLSIHLGPECAFATPLRHNSSSVRVNPYDGGTENNTQRDPQLAPSLKR
jgi:hypothetical protein